MIWSHSNHGGSVATTRLRLFTFVTILPAQNRPSREEIERMRDLTRQDHQNMMEQLGIERLRPGPSGNPDAPNAANYDPEKANPYPDLPELLVLKDGTKMSKACDPL